MKKYKEREITEKVVSSIICNKCGQSTDFKKDDDTEYHLFHGLECLFGYLSRYDNEHWEFDLCESCLIDFIKTFKYAPKGFGEDYRTDSNSQVLFDNWKETNVIDYKLRSSDDGESK